MKSYSIWGIFAATLLATGTAHAAENEINYGHISDIRGDTALIEYKSPGGNQYFTCDIDDGDCDDHGDTAPVLFPPLNNIGEYPKNAQGTLGIRQFVVGSFVFYILYDISDDEPKKLGALPVNKLMQKIRFTPDGESIIFVDSSNMVQRYDVMTQNLTNPVATQSSLPFLSISENGTYLAAYNYALGHRIWNLDTGASYTIQSTAPSYVEFSENETRVAYADKISGYKTLLTTKLSDLNNPSRVTTERSTVEDYVFAGNSLMYLANQSHPMTWSLYKYDGKESTRVDKEASYGDFMQSIDGKLAYLNIDGKNTNVHIYDPKEDDILEIKPIDDSPVPDDIEREAIYIAGLYGALLSPEKPNNDLFIWLHGGPQRQTSVGYHSYLSYAVYDELLEKLVSAGNYVLKLDYTGSTGYGDSFRTALHKSIGIKDVKDVRDVTKAFTKDHDIDNVYLIGNSYGGYLALKALADDADLYDGAISINGVTDWYGLITRIPSSPFNKLFEGVPSQTNLNAYLTASAYTGLVNNVRDEKILVAYGTNDSSVPIWQSTQYVEFAEANNKDVELLVLEGEEHVIRKRSSLVQLCERVTDFFNVKKVSCE